MDDRTAPADTVGADAHGRDRGSVLTMTLVLLIIGSVVVTALLAFATALFRGRPPIEERNAAAETAKGAMRMAMVLQGEKGPSGCFDPLADFTMNGMDVDVDCTPLPNTATETNYYETGRNRLALITTYNGAPDPALLPPPPDPAAPPPDPADPPPPPSDRGVVAPLTGGGGFQKAIDGGVVVAGGALDVDNSDILVQSADPATIHYSNAALTDAPAPEERYDVGYVPTGCTTGGTDSLGATYAAGPAFVCIDQPWWVMAGNDYDDYDGVVQRTYPVLPEMPSYTRSSTPIRVENSTAECYAFFPGQYSAPIVLDGNGGTRTFYFTSGVYLLNAPLTVQNGAQVVMGEGRYSGCTVDADAAFDLDAPKNHEITGEGVTLLLGDDATITSTNSTVRMNLRISSPTTRGSESMSIRSINGTAPVSANVGYVNVPEDRVQVGEYPYISDAGGPVLDVNGNPQPDPDDLSSSQLVSGYRFKLDDDTPSVAYTPSTITWSDPIVTADLRGGGDHRFVVDGQIFTPNAKVEILADSPGYTARLSGGVVASLVDLDASVAPADPSNWYLGVEREWVQRRVRLDVDVTAPSGVKTRSQALFQVHADGTYAINAWTVDPNGGSSAPPAGGGSTGGTDTGGTDTGGTDTGGTDTGGTDTGGTDTGGTDTGGTDTGGTDTGGTDTGGTDTGGTDTGGPTGYDYCANNSGSWTNDFGPGSWTAEYRNLPSWSSSTPSNPFGGSPDVTRSESQINAYWGSGSPASGVNSNYYSTRWTRTIDVAVACRIDLEAGGDDGYRVKITDPSGTTSTVIERWQDQAHAWSGVEEIDLAPGTHTIVVEYYEKGGQSSIELRWRKD